MKDLGRAVELIFEIANDDSHGYSQSNRYGPDYDCSSLIAHCLYSAGFLGVNEQLYTGNLYSSLIREGFEEIPDTGIWKPGDIHLTPFKHCCMSVNVIEIAEATANEFGGITGGKVGDQTGKEIYIHKYYVPSYGWTYHLRYTPKVYKTTYDIAKEVIAGAWGNGEFRKNALLGAGYDYTAVQEVVNAILSGDMKLKLDDIALQVIQGKWGNQPEREKRLTEAGYDYQLVRERVNKILNA